MKKLTPADTDIPPIAPSGLSPAASATLSARSSVSRPGFGWQDWLLIGLLLAAAMLGAWLPVDWTRNLKRPAQAPNYAWLTAGFGLLYAGGAWWLWRRPQDDQPYRGRWAGLALVGLVLLPNLLNIVLRYSAPLGPTDPRPLFGRDEDIGLFYGYGQALVEGRWPTNPQGQWAEYPQLSLPLFWLGVVLAGSNRETFYWVFPLLMTLCGVGAAVALWGLGRKMGQARAAFLLAAFAAGCPALLRWGYTRFDIAPTALLLGAVYLVMPGDWQGVRGLAARRRWGWSVAVAGSFIALGVFVKWLPGLIWPWLAAAFGRTRQWPGLLRFALASALTGLLVTLPAWLLNSEALLYPYRFQGSRRLIGESFWFLLQTSFLDPFHAVPDKPWGEPSRIFLGNNTLLLAQLGLTALVLALTAWRLWPVRAATQAFGGWTAAGLVGVAVFTLANRIFSPQYLVLLVWVWGASLVLRPLGWRSLALAFGLLSVAAGANFEVFLLGAYPDIWVRDSYLLFGASFVLSGWLLWRALLRPAPK